MKLPHPGKLSEVMPFLADFLLRELRELRSAMATGRARDAPRVTCRAIYRSLSNLSRRARNAPHGQKQNYR
jgi:hypothetical protein